MPGADELGPDSSATMCLAVVGAGPAISKEHVKVETIGDLHRLGHQNRSTLISFAKFEVLFKRREPGYRAALGRSQSGSQRAQPSGDAERRPATITPGEPHIRRHRATSGDWAQLIWEQEVAGSNPAIPTIFRICYLWVGANPVASCCRPMSASMAQRLRMFALTSPPGLPSHPANRTCIRLAANGLPVRGGDPVGRAGWLTGTSSVPGE
jgi:hypothetical protein